jgi:hypothetical protein
MRDRRLLGRSMVVAVVLTLGVVGCGGQSEVSRGGFTIFVHGGSLLHGEARMQDPSPSGPLTLPDSPVRGALGPGGFVSVVGRMLGEWKPWAMPRVWT